MCVCVQNLGIPVATHSSQPPTFTFAKQQTPDGLGFANGGGGDLSEGFKHAGVHASKAVGHGRLKGSWA